MAVNPYKQYQNVAVSTASPVQLVVMLYDGAIRFCRTAEEAIAEGRFEAANADLQRAQAVLDELMGSLNMEVGEIAQNLFRLYEYMRFRLVQANIRKDPELVREVTGLLRELRSAWARIGQSATAVRAETGGTVS